jgi:hypothetical protein
MSRKDSKKKNGKDTKKRHRELYTHERIRMTSTRVAKGVSNADFVSVACPEKNNDECEIETFFVLIENVLLPSAEEDGKYSRKDVVLDARVGKIVQMTEAFHASAFVP